MANIEDLILKRVAKKVDKALDVTAEMLANEISTAYGKTTDDFYKEYTPKVYQRTYSFPKAINTYKNVKNAVSKTGEMSREVNIEISSNYIDGEPYLDSKVDVFFNTYIEGKHGNIPKMCDLTPQQRMKDEVDKIKNLEHIQQLFSSNMV